MTAKTVPNASHLHWCKIRPISAALIPHSLFRPTSSSSRKTHSDTIPTLLSVVALPFWITCTHSDSTPKDSTSNSQTIRTICKNNSGVDFNSSLRHDSLLPGIDQRGAPVPCCQFCGRMSTLLRGWLMRSRRSHLYLQHFGLQVHVETAEEGVRGAWGLCFGSNAQSIRRRTRLCPPARRRSRRRRSRS